MINIFQCTSCGRESIANADKIFVCKFCKTRDNVKKLVIRLEKDINPLGDNQLIVEHFKVHKLYNLNMMLKSMNVKEMTKIVEIKDKHRKIVEELTKRNIVHKKTSRLDIDIKKYGTSEGALAAWDTRGRGRKEEIKADSPETEGVARDPDFLDYDNQKEVERAMKELPKEHLEGIKSVKVLTQRELVDRAIPYMARTTGIPNTPENKKFLEDCSKKVSGLNWDGEILINNELPEIYVKAGITHTGILAHEVGHNVWKNQDISKGFIASQWDDVRVGKGNISDILIGNENKIGEENFCGACRNYVTNGNKLKELSPKVHSYFKDVVFKGKEFHKSLLSKSLDIQDLPFYEYKIGKDNWIWSFEPIFNNKLPRRVLSKIPNLKRLNRNVEKMNTEPEMSPEIKAPTQFGLPRKSKKKVPRKIKAKK
jgi:hypothetical protein